MKNTLILLLAVSLLNACSGGGKTKDTATTTTTATAEPGTVAVFKPRNCQSVIEAGKLGKPLVYKESAKPLTFTLTLEQDTSTVETSSGCYFNNTITVLATKKTGKQAFKRTLLKDDLRYFIKNEEILKPTILLTVTYKPTFNGERYFNLTMRLIEPVSKKTTDFTLFMNYNGEILKVK